MPDFLISPTISMDGCFLPTSYDMTAFIPASVYSGKIIMEEQFM